MFGKKKVDDVLGALSKVVTDLDAIEDAQRAESVRAAGEMREAALRASEAEQESERARRVRNKIAELLA